MRIAYFDCFSGISGDMTLAALIDAGLDFGRLKSEMAKLDLDFDISFERVVKQNIASGRIHIRAKEEKHHRHLKDLNALVEKSHLPPQIVAGAKNIFHKIAAAEARIHNVPVEKIHFHEVGAIDTIVDVVGVLIGIDLLGIEKIYCSRINVGSGFVTFSHGTFPVPAPATAELLKGIPTYSTDSGGELVTPTGAAIISSICTTFGDMPTAAWESIGYGAGSKEFKQANVLRLYIGQSAEADKKDEQRISIIETNIDDMNPQLYEHVFELLLAHGALDVFLIPVLMKKNRPGNLLTVLAKPGDQERLIRLLFEETTTLGIRIRSEDRVVLDRQLKKIDTPYGPVTFKISRLDGKTVNVMPEYQDVKEISQRTGLALKTLYKELGNIPAEDE